MDKNPSPIYLDYNATTPLHPGWTEGKLFSLYREFGNPSSLHARGRKARDLLEEARGKVLELLGFSDADYEYKLVFAASGTEANRLALEKIRENPHKATIAISDAEHPSLSRQIPILQKLGVTIRKIPLLPSGQIDPDWLEEDTNKYNYDLLILQSANNETGILQDIPYITEICERKMIDWHCDSVQTIGKSSIDYSRMNCKSLTLSGHKFYAPKGTAAIIYRGKMSATLQGGSQENGMRPGTENLPGILAFAQSLEWVMAEETELIQKQKNLQDRLESYLESKTETYKIIGDGQNRLSNTTCFAIQGIPSEIIQQKLDSLGFQVSVGSACSSGSWEPSSTLLAMGVDREMARSTIRVSTGIPTDTQAMERFISALDNLS